MRRGWARWSARCKRRLSDQLDDHHAVRVPIRGQGIDTNAINADKVTRTPLISSAARRHIEGDRKVCRRLPIVEEQAADVIHVAAVE